MSTYRQGTVLGLTVAEIFILLTFLLLLLLVYWHEEQELEKTIVLEDGTAVPGVWVRPDKIETLEQRLEEKNKALNAAEKRREIVQQNLKRAELTIDSLLAASDSDVLDMAEALEQANQAILDKERVEKELATLKQKGENPPCWYQIAPKWDNPEEFREKPYYLLGIGIHEEYIELTKLSPPPGRAEDDNGDPFEVEWDRLAVDDLPYGIQLSDQQFREAVEHIASAGKNSEVRTYECIFWVKVWDFLPERSKERWQKVHDDLIEEVFGAYRVRDDPWPETSS